MINQCDFEEILKDIPSKWRDAIIQILLQITASCTSGTIDCADVKECETVTSISEWTVTGTEVCIKFTNELGVEVERCFDIENILNEQLNNGNIDPGCITTPTIWNTLSYTEKFQALIDTVCNCCPATTSTTTTTTVPEETTTTTTTIP